MIKKLIFLIIGCMIWTSASAEVYLIVKNSTKEIYSMSNEDDAVMPLQGYKKIILPGELKEYPLLHHPKYYKYQNKKFVVNVKKLSDEEVAAEDRNNEKKERDLVKARMWNNAINELKTQGVVFQRINVIPEVIP